MIIEKLDGERIDLKDTPIRLLTLTKSSPSPQISTEKIDTVDGILPVDTTFDSRLLRGSFYIRSTNIYDYYLLQNEVFKIFMTKEPFYLIHKREPDRRWKVQVANEFSLNKIGLVGTFDIEFVSFSPYAESIGTTLHPESRDYYFMVGGTKITKYDPPVKYSFNENTFAVFNESDITIDPRNANRYLKITLKGILNNPSIRNLTTGDIWSWEGSAESYDTIVLNGVRSLKNGASIFRQTNRQLITLAPGWNHFEVLNAVDFTIELDFRFYYF